MTGQKETNKQNDERAKNAETVFDSINLELTPLLVFKTTRKGTHCALPKLFLDSLTLDYYSAYRDFIIIGLEQFELNKEAIKNFAIDNEDVVAN